MNFFETVMGKRFFEYTAPNIARSLERIADAMEAKPVTEADPSILKRYSLCNVNDDGPEVLDMDERPYGEYVKLEDVKKLLKKTD